jgi:hypothetical protein
MGPQTQPVSCKGSGLSFGGNLGGGLRKPSVAQRPFGTAPLISIKDPCRFSLHTDKGQEEVVMPVDSILFSVAVIAVLAFVAALFWADFQSRSL